MTNFRWWLIGLITMGVILVLLFVSRSDYEALRADYDALGQQHSSLSTQLQQAQSDLTELQADHEALNADYDGLNADYEVVNQELADIKEVYPPRDFSSVPELESWLQANDVSDQPLTTTYEDWYSKALQIQEDALKDGYITSVDYDYYPETDSFGIWCVTIINGDIWVWDPETDEPFQDPSLGKVR